VAYMNQAMKATIAENLKPVLKKYGVKGSLSVRNHMTVVLTIKSGKVNFFNESLKSEFSSVSGYMSVNPYWYHEHFTGESKAFLTEAIDALKSAGHYDDSDASIDYFNTAYYFDIKVGQCDKPYLLTA
jgi:hypothetical protein